MPRPDAPTQGEVRCADCNDTGIISRPYIAGVVSVSHACPCAHPRKEQADD